MDLTQAVSGRRSIRRFRSDPVPPELVRRVIEAAFAAPVGTREECRYFLVLTGEAKARLLDEVVEPGLARLAESLQECAARDTVRYTRSLVAPLRQAPVAIAA
jgi:nitroreductase